MCTLPTHIVYWDALSRVHGRGIVKKKLRFFVTVQRIVKANSIRSLGAPSPLLLERVLTLRAEQLRLFAAYVDGA